MQKIKSADTKYAFRKTICSKSDPEYGIGLLGITGTTRYYEKEFSIDKYETWFREHNVSNGPAGITFPATLIVSGTITYFLPKESALPSLWVL